MYFQAQAPTPALPVAQVAQSSVTATPARWTVATPIGATEVSPTLTRTEDLHLTPTSTELAEETLSLTQVESLRSTVTFTETPRLTVTTTPAPVLNGELLLTVTPTQEVKGSGLLSAPATGPTRLELWTGAEVPVVPASGEMIEGVWQWALPDTVKQAAWHTDTADCGHGVTVIGGHSTLGQSGPLMALNTIGPDDAVVCYDAQGHPHRFVPQDYLLGGRDDPRNWYPDWTGNMLIMYTCQSDLRKQVIVRFIMEGELEQ